MPTVTTSLKRGRAAISEAPSGVRSRIRTRTSKIDQPRRQSGFVSHVVVEHHHAGFGAKPRPIGKGMGEVLVIVEDGDPKGGG